MLTAVLYRHGKLNLLGNDLYVSTIAGGIAKEPGCDLKRLSRRWPAPLSTRLSPEPPAQ